MEVREIMSPVVECTRPDAPVQEVAKRMRDLNVGTMPVCEDQERLVGIITDRDITIRMVANGKGPETPVQGAMTSPVVHCLDTHDVKDAAQLMKDHQIRRLVVLDGTKRLVGIVTLGDLAVETSGAQLVADALERISEPVHPVQ